MLITRHLQFSLPYRALFSHTLRPDTMNRLLDALAALLVRLHLAGFFWGDCSLSNTLFRRDAGAFAAYLVDAETGAAAPAAVRRASAPRTSRSPASTSSARCSTCRPPGCCTTSIDPEDVADDVRRPLRDGCGTSSPTSTRWHRRRPAPHRAAHPPAQRARLRRGRGADVARPDDGYRACRPKVVDAGHHTRRLLRLTGLDAEENQARALLNDLDAYRARERPAPTSSRRRTGG